MKKKNKKLLPLLISVILTVCLAGIIWFYADHCKQVAEFNKELHTAEGKYTDRSSAFSALDSGEKEDVIMSLYFRGGSNDIWTKEKTVMTHSLGDFVGEIYEMRISNFGEYTIGDWYMRQNIHQDCYINNAWCGTIEIHQFEEDGSENVQTLDMRNDIDTGSLTLDYEMSDEDFLIPLHDGDYFIYYPSTEVSETPLYAQSETSSGTVTCGFIYYFWANGLTGIKDMDLSDSTIYYHYKMSVSQGPEYLLVVLLLVIWVVVAAAFSIIMITLKVDAKKLSQREEFIDESLTVFTHFVDAKDPYTKGHSNRVALYSSAIAEAMGMSETECKNVYYIALLHDVGKCYIDDGILKKPSRLTPEEFEQIKSHTTLGANMLKDLKSLPDIYNGALYHHERYDGKGYPTGKAGEEIPLIARIICVADSFDAMNSDRCYRTKLSSDVIYNEIKNNRGTQFDPKIADIFLKLLDAGRFPY